MVSVLDKKVQDKSHAGRGKLWSRVLASLQLGLRIRPAEGHA